MSYSIRLHASSSDYVQITNGGDFKNFDKFSVGLWFKPATTYDNTLSQPVTLIGTNKSANNNGDWHLEISANTGYKGQLNFMLQTGSATYQCFATQNTWNAGTWYHVFGVFDRALSSQRLKLYVDAQTPFTLDGADIQIGDNGADVYLGRMESAPPAYFDGNIEQVLAYKNVALTDAQIANIYSGGTPPSTGLKLYLAFEQNVSDQSGSGNNGAAYGSPTYEADEPPFSSSSSSSSLSSSSSSLSSSSFSSSSFSSSSSSSDSEFSSSSSSSSSLSSSNSSSSSSQSLSSSSSNSSSSSSQSLSSSSSSSTSATGTLLGTIKDRAGNVVNCSLYNVRINVYPKNNTSQAPTATFLNTNNDGTWSISGLAASTKYLVAFEYEGTYTPLGDIDVAGAEFMSSN